MWTFWLFQCASPIFHIFQVVSWKMVSVFVVWTYVYWDLDFKFSKKSTWFKGNTFSIA